MPKFLKRIISTPSRIIREVTKPVVKVLPEGVRNALPTIGSVIGGSVGGPFGAVIGGQIGGSMRGGKHHFDHSMGGALQGLGHAVFSPMLGSSLGLNPDSFLAKAMMMNSPSLLGQMGIPGFSEAGLNGQRMAQMAAAESGGAGGLGGGILGNGLSGVSGGAGSGLLGGGGFLGGGNLLKAALLATSLGGSLRAKKKNSHRERESETLDDAIKRARHSDDSSKYFRELPPRNSAQFPPEGYRGLDWNYFPSMEQQAEQLIRANDKIDRTRSYKKGGNVKGYYKGGNSGQSDKVLTRVPPNTHIVDATTVSLSGDGNSDNGARVVKDWVNSFQNGHFEQQDQSGKTVPIYVSDGEFEILPDEVLAIGGGDMEKGHRIINSMKKGIRKHKGVKKFLPPKSKPLDKYAGIKR